MDLRLREYPHRIRVEVRDSNPYPPVPTAPLDDDARNLEAESGRRLLIVEALATAWGSSPAGRGKTTWFEIGVRGDEPPQTVSARFTALMAAPTALIAAMAHASTSSAASWTPALLAGVHGAHPGCRQAPVLHLELQPAMTPPPRHQHTPHDQGMLRQALASIVHEPSSGR
ncbi:ATP-binding protein [Streptomyces rhizosphaericus]|uniref:ATP-binding protein n=1 Tax=Streptomyces rhizosphaericus TaxID=114699 RepID=UPI001C3FA2EC|nr:ATP-binding protein [Streptomyces cangkringensis]